MAVEFNVDAGALLDEQSQTIASLLKENLILKHQLKDAEARLGGQDEDEAAEVTTLPKSRRKSVDPQ